MPCYSVSWWNSGKGTGLKVKVKSRCSRKGSCKEVLCSSSQPEYLPLPSHFQIAGQNPLLQTACLFLTITPSMAKRLPHSCYILLFFSFLGFVAERSTTVRAYFSNPESHSHLPLYQTWKHLLRHSKLSLHLLQWLTSRVSLPISLDLSHLGTAT